MGRPGEGSAGARPPTLVHPSSLLTRPASLPTATDRTLALEHAAEGAPSVPFCVLVGLPRFFAVCPLACVGMRPQCGCLVCAKLFFFSSLCVGILFVFPFYLARHILA